MGEGNENLFYASHDFPNINFNIIIPSVFFLDFQLVYSLQVLQSKLYTHYSCLPFTYVTLLKRMVLRFVCGPNPLSQCQLQNHSLPHYSTDGPK
jgi:hypothetical protein